MAVILAKMQECFATASAEANKLDEAVARHFTRIGANAQNLTLLTPNFSICGSCNRSMALRQVPSNQNGRGDNQQSNLKIKILVCSPCSFACRLSRGVPNPVSDFNTGPQLCPICNYQVIKITEGDGYAGNGYTLCPKCYTEPPVEHGGAGLNDFPCKKCTHPTCALAGGVPGGDVEIYSCPFCAPFGSAGKIFLKKNAKGFVLSCSNHSTGARSCEYIVWLPKEAIAIAIPGEDETLPGPDLFCSNCTKPNAIVRKLKFTWRSGSLPTSYDREVVACILCDDLFKGDILRINLPALDRVRVRSTNDHINGRARGGGRSSGNSAGRGRGRGNQTNNAGRSNSSGRNALNGCFNCGGQGHFAQACPHRG